jgi:uncharacterized protein YjiS (DUF1127 family)
MQVQQATSPASWRAIVMVFRLWRQRGATRRALLNLQARELEDVGLTEHDRAAECAKWFWQE